ncbi:hypothetical protein Scep_027603 [Stephania cephalantha]|uniref:Uncharacterized protein n=1 Tax=Stephania cephalantha TaxID=152367 RepID=A0AAP0E8C2_9MAGN
MSQRKEIIEDGKELFFDHGAPFFTVRDNDVMSLVCEWESRALVTQWKESRGCFDCVSRKFGDNEKVWFACMPSFDISLLHEFRHLYSFLR